MRYLLTLSVPLCGQRSVVVAKDFAHGQSAGRSCVVLFYILPGGVVSVASVDTLFSLIMDSSRYMVNRTSFATWLIISREVCRKSCKYLTPRRDPSSLWFRAVVDKRSLQEVHVGHARDQSRRRVQTCTVSPVLSEVD